MKRSHLVFTVLILLVVILGACNIPNATSPSNSDDPVKTAAAETVAALTTQIAATDMANKLLTPSPTITNTLAPSETLQPSNTPFPTATNTPPGVCDRAGFVSETIPDGSDFSPNQAFTKTWTIKNVGTCTWNSNYAVVFTSGSNAMGAPASKQLTTGTVAPNQTVVVSLDMTSPAVAGSYKAEFKLRNSNGVIFGFGEDNRSFFALIDVVVPAYNLAQNYCSAVWTSGAGVLPCPGTEGHPNGYVFADATPKLENGYEDDELALWMGPQNINNGWIKGVFPAVNVAQGMYFYSIIGCHPDAVACNVQMRLNYIADGGPEQNLYLWTETRDGIFKRIKADISALAGKSVQFILIVEANGSPLDDRVHWFVPSIGP
ncbi:MAG: NBR1-Ig-like domain-containing protein [Anaerolineaceae bacterium]|nr:NBR1-Ig-like domain-containing protein [Anaerolineaceae bacterium]